MPTVNELRAEWVRGFKECQQGRAELRPVGHLALVEAYQAGWDCWTDYLIERLRFTMGLREEPATPDAKAEFNRYIGG